MVADGKISRVAVRPEPIDVPVHDFGDLIISPGIVDAHVHINEPERPGTTPWEGFKSATSAAAAGGVTTILDMPLNSIPVTTTTEALRQKRAAAQSKCHIDVGFYGGLVPENASEIAPLTKAGVLGIKAFMCDSGLDEFGGAGEDNLRNALSVLKKSGVPLLAHAEIVSPNMASPQNPCSYDAYKNSRPPEFELTAIKLLTELCREFETPIHIVHLATAEALPLIEQAKHEGLPLKVETCPHYLFFSDDQIDDGQTSYKCAPPIRDEANRIALCKAVKSGLIETIGSDHSPCPPELKELETGNFFKAWGGIAGLQLSLPVVWTLGSKLGWTTSLLAMRLSQLPAEIFGLGDRKGKIATGYDADFVVWDPNACFDIRGKELFHRHPVTPYEGCELNGVVERTYVRGSVVFEKGKLMGGPAGKLLRPESDQIAKWLNGLDSELATALETCCAAQDWVTGMVKEGDFENDEAVIDRADAVWNTIGESTDHETVWLEAFSAHPRIGDINTLREKYSNTKKIASGEQSGVESAEEATLQRLAIANDEYFEKFGFIFIVCATGKSAKEMLAILEDRLLNDRDTELKIAAQEQLKITKIRLRKLGS